MAYRRQNIENADRLSKIYTETPGLLYLLDATGAIVEVSELMLAHFGYKRHDILGRNARDLMSASARRDFLQVREQLWAEGGCCDLPSQFVAASGQVRDVRISASIESDGNGIPVRVKCVLTDVTQQLEMQRTLEARARTDGLTNVSNRAWFHERVHAELERARRHRRSLALVVFDVDWFKQLNDDYGHAAGDDALRMIAKQAGRGLRGSDEVGRIGGEEFALLLPETDLDGALQVAERLRASIQSLDWQLINIERKTTISLGVSIAAPETAADELFKQADAAMYAAKHAGRNRVLAWTPAVGLADKDKPPITKAPTPRYLSHGDTALDQMLAELLDSVV